MATKRDKRVLPPQPDCTQLLNEELVPIYQLRRHFPLAPSGRQLWSYARYGLKDRHGNQVRLEAVRTAQTYATSVAAYKRFMLRISKE
jgi:hypothetical protein